MTARLSREAKRVRGTARPSREIRPTALERFRVAPSAPEHLSERARREWDNLARVTVELGTLTGADLRSLELLSEILATEAELRELLKAEGLTVAGANDNKKAHPAARLLESTRNQAQRLLSDFGLTPRGRLSVDVRPPVRANRFTANGNRDPAERYFDGLKPWESRND